MRHLTIPQAIKLASDSKAVVDIRHQNPLVALQEIRKLQPNVDWVENLDGSVSVFGYSAADLEDTKSWSILIRPESRGAMLIIKCSACRKKLWRYRKLGQGEVLRCHRDRIEKVWFKDEHDGKVWCQCGNAVGMDKGTFIKMNKNACTCSGTKINT